MAHRNFEEQIRQLGALSDTTRRAVYAYVAGRGREVGRDEASKALGISRALAAFHLDRLVEEGLLETAFRRLTPTTGPGAGRPAKLYRRSGVRVEVSLPQTQYEMAARLLARAIGEAESNETERTLSLLAGEQGQEIGAEARRRAGPRPSRAVLREQAVRVLTEYGFEPFTGPGDEILLRNCPFNGAVQANRDIICGMNLALMEGLVRGLRLQGVAARLDPKPGLCCVAIGGK
jgi:predicted ArsR family transcriptional regulator